jgi:hypothetical protein
MIKNNPAANILPKEKSGYSKRIDMLREDFLTAVGSNDYEAMIKSLVQTMYEIKPLVTDKRLRDQLDNIRKIHLWFLTLEKRYTKKGEFGNKLVLPQNIVVRMDRYISIANNIIVRNMHKLDMCKY